MVHASSTGLLAGLGAHTTPSKGGKGAANLILELFGEALSGQLQKAGLLGEAGVVDGKPLGGLLSDKLPLFSGVKPVDVPVSEDEADAFLALLGGEMPPVAVMPNGFAQKLQPVPVAQGRADALEGVSLGKDLGASTVLKKTPLVLAGEKTLPNAPAGISMVGLGRGAELTEEGVPLQLKGQETELLSLNLGRQSAGFEGSSAAPVQTVPALGQELASSIAPRAANEVAVATRPSVVVPTPMHHPQWSSDFADKVVWLSGKQGQVAELILTPPSLGSVEVRLNLNGSEAGAQFFSSNPAVREAIEAALPRLRELMQGAGINLGEATVSQESFRERLAEDARGDKRGSDEDEGLAELDLSGQAARYVHKGLGAVDLFV